MLASRRILLLTFVAAIAFSAAHAERPTPKPQEAFAPYWTTEPGWETELQLKNNLIAGPLTVTPILRLASGEEIPLDPVTVQSNTVTSLNVNEALSKHSATLPGAALYGSVAFRYISKQTKALTAEVMIHMHGQPIGYHVDAFPIFSEPRSSSREGIWWQPREAIRDFLVLSNSLDKRISGTLSLFDATGKNWSELLTLSPHQTFRTSVSELVRRAAFNGNFGGIKFEVSANAGAVDSVHFLYDETAGFSAMMKIFERDPGAKLEERTWAGNKQWTMWAPMLALQSPDPTLGFPVGAVLQPTIFLHNTTPKTVTANIALSWRGSLGTGKVTLPALRLKGYASERLDIAAMEKKLGIPGDAH